MDKQRTSQDADEELTKTLYVRLPHTIKNEKEIRELFLGDIKIRLPRQSSRYCHVIFPNVEEKLKNLKNIKKKLVDGKRILACPPRIKPPEEKKGKEKKIKIEKTKPEQKSVKTIFVSNIKLGTKQKDVKLAFPGCTAAVMLKADGSNSRKAILKFASAQVAGEYLRKERQWPTVNGNKLVIKQDTRIRKKSKKNESSPLKIYDGETEIKNEDTKKQQASSSNKNKSTTPKIKRKNETRQDSKEKVEMESEDDEEDEEEDDETNSEEETDVEEE